MQFQPTVGRAFVCICVCQGVCVSVRVCMHVSPLHFESIVQVGNKRFREFEKKTDYGWTDGRTDGTTERRTDGQTLI